MVLNTVIKSFTLVAIAATVIVMSVGMPSTDAHADIPYNPISSVRTISKLDSPYAISSLNFGEIKISSQYSNKQGADCIFIPSGMDLSNVEILFNMKASALYQIGRNWNVEVSGNLGTVSTLVNDEYMSCITIDLNSITSFDEYGIGHVTVSFLDDLSAPDITYMVVACSSTSSIMVTSDDPQQGREYIEQDKSIAVKASVSAYSSDGIAQLLDLDCDSIKGRGNSSFYGTTKKSYNIKLSDKADLLGN